MVNIKHLLTNEIHILNNSRTTACGVDITLNLEYLEWIGDNAKTIFNKKDCK